MAAVAAAAAAGSGAGGNGTKVATAADAASVAGVRDGVASMSIGGDGGAEQPVTVARSVELAYGKLEELQHVRDFVFTLSNEDKRAKLESIILDIDRLLVACGAGPTVGVTVPKLQSASATVTKPASPNRRAGGGASKAGGAGAAGSSPTSAKAAAAISRSESEAQVMNARLTEQRLTFKEKAQVVYIRGKALDALDSYVPEAEKLLAKAVKLAPENVEAWNALANCFWKKGDLAQAAECFQRALERGPNAHSHRELSMLRRQLGSTNDERVENISQSLLDAKAALKLDFADSKSWYVLGNAHLSHFFSLRHDPEDLKRALKAYQRAHDLAEKSGAPRNPDLYYNRANVHKYLEHYDEAVADFRTSTEIDPRLPGAGAAAYIEKAVAKIQRLVESKCRTKPKRLAATINALRSSPHHARVLEAVEQQKENKATDDNAGGEQAGVKGSAANFEVVGIKSLRPGRNPGKIVPMKLLMPVVHQASNDPPA